MGEATSAPDAAARLRAAGHRVTPQRLKVLETLASEGHATPEQLVRPGVDLATVYRTLSLLEDLGLVQHTHLGHGSPTWSVRVEDGAHLHLVCSGCEAVIEVDAGAVAPLVDVLKRQHGFSVDIGHVSLTGECLQCRSNRGETD